MIRCKAFVETIRPPTPFRPGDYEVQVTGEEPNDYVRIYRILARTEDEAARDAIDRFMTDIDKLLEGEKA